MDLNGARRELFEFLRIPSISAHPEHAPDVRGAARWVVGALQRAGLQAELLETAGHPVAFGEWRGAGDGAPTLLVYGHYDVQPPEPLDLWTTPPFEPDLRQGRIYARGAADNKGQLFIQLKAVHEALARTGSLPVNVLFLAEGEEEIASPNLLPLIRAHRDRFAADAVLISDSAMFAPGLPSLLFSLRGMAYFEIRVKGVTRDLHSGSYGGAVPNAASALVQILSTLHDRDNRVAIDGFYDGVDQWDTGTRDQVRALPFREQEFMIEAGATGLEGESGYSTLERLWIRPTCEVNGLLAGYTGDGAKTVLPASAMAKLSFRLVPNQDPVEVGDQLKAHISRNTPPSVDVEVVQLAGGKPWRADLQGEFFEAARTALRAGFGVDPVLTGEGASIPIVTDLEELLGARAVLMGFALPGANMHAPDEWFPDSHLEMGVETLLNFYDELSHR
jgi:acetylornithine deacetylase/succinyl-diaminopimelate desuccinylase-like protein